MIIIIIMFVTTFWTWFDPEISQILAILLELNNKNRKNEIKILL